MQREVFEAKEDLLEAMEEVSKAASVHLKGLEGDRFEGVLPPTLELCRQPTQGEIRSRIVIKVLLAFCIGALLVFVACEVAGAAPEGHVDCDYGKLGILYAKAEFEPDDFAHAGEYAIDWHWEREADPCGDRWLMPTEMFRDNLWWVEQWIRSATRNDDFHLTVGVFNLTQALTGDEWACSGIAGGCARVTTCGRGEVQILEGDIAIGTIGLVKLIHELTHVIVLNLQRCWPEDYSFESHGQTFYSLYRWALLSLLDEDILPYCIEHGMWCEWGTP